MTYSKHSAAALKAWVSRRGPYYHLTPRSDNRKTGRIAVTTSSQKTCPHTCPFKKNGCYADGGPLLLHWRKLTQGQRGLTYTQFLEALRNLDRSKQTRMRLWQAGDMPGEGNAILSSKEIEQLIDATYGIETFSYTHKPVLPQKGVSKILAEQNAKKIKQCNDYGLTINLSANSPKHADELADLGIGPVVTVLPSNAAKGMTTPAGRKIVICPATISDHISCETCGGDSGALCARNARNYVIGFPAHGVRKGKASEVANGIKG